MKEKIASYISAWKRKGYANGIPDEADPRLEAMCKAPSYRAICRAILRNDVSLSTLGFQRHQCDAYMAIKSIEIEARNERLRSSKKEDSSDI